MRKEQRPGIDPDEIAEVQAIVDRLTKRKPEKAKEPVWVQRVERVSKTLWQSGITGYLVAIAIALVISVAPSDALKATGLTILLLALLLILTVMALSGIQVIPLLVALFKRPFDPIFELVSSAIWADLDSVNRLSRCNREAVEYVLAQYRHQRLAFETRGSALAGQLEKLGLFPVLATFAAASTVLLSSPYQWLRGFLFLVPAFHFLKLMSLAITQEMDRAIALLEYSLAARDRSDSDDEKQKEAA
ncbi:hypothetical protein [Ralstonia pseudosolanacearum]|uniref:hypothetical protein n=1 Tax=Ralstonia pseudosolanacearum TaxID=1310165 RepID=UPI002005B5BC|nr:hypothetical protein [Ralstonia pseudosolanacearum]MCK4152001.1 hypothetical protein [Ralstonia pseudosolanacearum]